MLNKVNIDINLFSMMRWFLLLFTSSCYRLMSPMWKPNEAKHEDLSSTRNNTFMVKTTSMRFVFIHCVCKFCSIFQDLKESFWTLLLQKNYLQELLYLYYCCWQRLLPHILISSSTIINLSLTLWREMPINSALKMYASRKQF